MTNTGSAETGLRAGTKAIQLVHDKLGPFVVATDKTRMPIVFTDARSEKNEIVYANESFLELTSYSASEAIGLPFESIIAKQDRMTAMLEVITNKFGGNFDLHCLRKDESKFESSLIVSPVLDANGELQQYFVCFLDLTPRLEARLTQRLREVEIYEHAPGFIAFTKGPEHTFTFANAAYEVLVGRKELAGQRVTDVMPELADQGFIKSLDWVYRSGQRLVGKNVAISLKRGPGDELEKRYVDYIYQPVRDGSGNVMGLFCEGSDMTDIHAVSEKLTDVQNELMHVARTNAMGTMAATLAHELNQPLTAIANYASGCANLLERSGFRSDEIRDGLVAIGAASERAGKIIRSLRLMTKRTTPVQELFDLGSALEESVHLVQVGGCNDIAISAQFDKSVLVLGNKIQVQQILVNLLRNACEAASQRGSAGQVYASAAHKNGAPCVVVRDTGLGLPETMRDDVFKWGESTKADGMGIGLSISRTIAEAHGGSLSLDETGPSGTSFTLCFPVPEVE